jgi:carlactone synthase/all-trans-10'-apo-beta-carotenal 13,14-cleaving dioxygenase
MLALTSGVFALNPASTCRTARNTAFASCVHSPVADLPFDVVEGSVPSWLKGSYLRNGPGLFEVGERRLEHWFDGYGMLMRVKLDGDAPPLLTTQFVDSDAFRSVKERNAMGFAEFMKPLVELGSGLPEQLRGLAELAFGAPTDNACVNVCSYPSSERLVAMTETQRSWWSVDLETLATKERVTWCGDDVGQLSTAHAQRDPAGGGWVNVGTQIAPPFWSQYHIFRLSDDATAERQILASIPCADGAAPNWLHSFALTRNKVVVLEQPAAYSVAAMVGLASASHGSIQWNAEEGTRVHVLDRATNALTTHVVQPAFFFFHVANAFDAPDDSGEVMVDLCSFDSPEIVTALRLDRLTNDDLATDLPTSRLVRLTIPAGGRRPPTTHHLDDLSVTGGFSDLPTIAPGAHGVPSYRFVYSIGVDRPTVVSNRLVKTDVSGGGGGAAFAVPGMLPGEPLFVPRPGGTEEDDGVVLSMGTDPEGSTSLYVLDARNMRLVARCRCAIALPAGFHGEWCSDDCSDDTHEPK